MTKIINTNKLQLEIRNGTTQSNLEKEEWNWRNQPA